MSSPGISVHDLVTWCRVEVKECKVEREEWRCTQMAALHLARKSGNSALSQSTLERPEDRSWAQEGRGGKDT